MIFVILFKMDKHSDFHLIFFQIVGLWQDCKAVTKRITIFRVYMALGDAGPQFEDLRPGPNVELHMRRTKLSELSS